MNTQEYINNNSYIAPISLDIQDQRRSKQNHMVQS